VKEVRFRQLNAQVMATEQYMDLGLLKTDRNARWELWHRTLQLAKVSIMLSQPLETFQCYEHCNQHLDILACNV
jgi:hypothetical protein